MDNSKYYMRSKGKLFGPFDIEKLKRLAAKGTLTAADELSMDRQTWTAAGKVAELFAPEEVGRPCKPRGSPRRQAPRRNPPVPASKGAAAPAATVEEEEREIVPDQTTRPLNMQPRDSPRPILRSAATFWPIETRDQKYRRLWWPF